MTQQAVSMRDEKGPSPDTPASAETTDDPTAIFAAEVRAGLTAKPKTLSPKWHYDELGSRLFEAICALPEYTIPRAERAILAAHAAEMVAGLEAPVSLVELGSGDAVKTPVLIEALLARQPHLRYVPIDISEAALERSRREMSLYPEVEVLPRQGDYLRSLADLAHEGRREGATLVLFLGSTLGNLHLPEAIELVRGIREPLQPGDALLLGLDLRKPEEVLIPAYDDPLGVTAAFNLNLLARINRELGGGFDLDRFEHRALWNGEMGRMEMHLVSRVEQRVPVAALGIDIPFAAGETIHTECSYKYDDEQIGRIAREAGFERGPTWVDPEGLFSSNLFLVR